MKKPALILYLLVILTAAWLGTAQVQALGLLVGDQEAILSQPISIVNGSILVPLHVVTDYLGGQVTWSAKGETVQLDFPDLTITMRVGEESAQVNGTSYRLEVPIEFSQGDLMVPLRFIVDHLRLSLTFDGEKGALRIQGRYLDAAADSSEVVHPSEREHVIYTPEPQQDLKEIVYIGGPRSRVFVDVANYSGYQTMLLVNPDRLVLDLYGVQGEPLPDQLVNGPIVKQIRSSLFDGNTIRVVFDLNEATGYTITPWPEGGLEVEFNYQLLSVGFERADGVPKIVIEATDKPPIETIHLTQPSRLVIDLHNTSLIGGAVELAVEDPVVRRWRVSQNTPAVTRIVLELNEPLTLWDVEGDNGRYALVFFEGTPEQAAAKREEIAARERAEALRALEEARRAAQEAQERAAQPKETVVDETVVAEPKGDGILAGYVIMIDPGHGGSDPGAIGPYGTFEKDVNLAISLALGKLLDEAGAEVHFTRTEDVYVSIFERPQMAHHVGAHILVSVHANAYLDQNIARGTETLYNPNRESNQLLAQAIQTELVKELQLYDRGLRKRTDLAVLNGSQIPTALVEVAFLNHPEEEVLLRAPGFQQAAAQGIFNGIVRYFAEHAPKEE